MRRLVGGVAPAVAVPEELDGEGEDLSRGLKVSLG